MASQEECVNVMIKNKVIALIAYIAIFFVVWNLLDFLLVTFVTHGSFSFTVFGNAVLPTVVAIVTGFMAIRRKK